MTNTDYESQQLKLRADWEHDSEWVPNDPNTSQTLLWQLTLREQNIGGGVDQILTEDVAIGGYSYQEGDRRRYTDSGWEKAKRRGFAELDVRDFGAVPDDVVPVQPELSLADQNKILWSCLRELIEQIDCLDGIEYSKDTEPYKAEACWEDTLRLAREALERCK
jgi:hypothetical protein